MEEKSSIEEGEREEKDWLSHNKNYYRRERINSENDFKRILRSGKRIVRNEFKIFILKNGFGYSRFAVVAGIKIGNSVKRNRIKRVIREVFRRNKTAIGNGFDIIIIPKKNLNNITYFNLKEKILNAIKGIKK